MKKYPFGAILDFWENYKSMIVTEKINLIDTKICVISKMESKNKDGMSVIPYNSINVDTMKIGRNGTLKVKNTELLNMIKAAGSFYKYNGKYYIPSSSVRRRVSYDYFRSTAEKRKKRNGIIDEYENINLKSFASDETLITVAQRFRKVKSIIFIGQRLSGSCIKLVGMKSAGTDKQVYAIDVIKELNRNNDIDFYTSFPEDAGLSNMAFEIECDIKRTTKNGIPLSVFVSDNITGRKALRIDIRAEINNRKYILKSLDITHRTVKSAEEIANMIESEIKEYENASLNKDVSIDEIEDVCIRHIPKKSQKKFKDAMFKNASIETAYDISQKLFESERSYKTQDYDRGKHKYDIALGSVLKIC